MKRADCVVVSDRHYALLCFGGAAIGVLPWGLSWIVVGCDLMRSCLQAQGRPMQMAGQVGSTLKRSRALIVLWMYGTRTTRYADMGLRMGLQLGIRALEV